MSKSLLLLRSTPLWCWPLMCLCVLLLVPVFAIVSSLWQPQWEVWQHLQSTVLSDYVFNSLGLVLGVGALSLLFGVGSAWLIACCQLPGKAYLQWMLLLPMAIPAYIMAYVYTGMLDFSGPVQSQLRSWMGWSYGDYYFPEVRSLGGAILMLGLALYPYIYMLARTAFAAQSLSSWESARSLGLQPRQVFWRVSLPMARPAIISGLALVLMETLADYGTVQYFGVSVLSTGIYRTWFGLDNILAASQLAVALLVFVLLFLALEAYGRRGSRFHQTGASLGQRGLPLSRMQRWFAVLFCLLPIVLGFLWPFAQLCIWVISHTERFDDGYWRLLWNTLALSAGTALLAVSLGLALVYMRRLVQHKVIGLLVLLAGLGYAVPGTVIAVGVMRPFAGLDQTLNYYWLQWFDYQPGLIFSGTLFVLVFAYIVRFMAVSISSVQAGMNTVTPSMDEAARGLGLKPWSVVRRVHLPLLKGGILSALLLVFVDTLKELPVTLVLRPFNFNTLAVRSYELANDEQLISAAPTVITIVLIGLLPVILLNRSALNKH